MRMRRCKPDGNHSAGIGLGRADGRRIVPAYLTDGPPADRRAIPEASGFDDDPDAAGDSPSPSDFYGVPAMSRRTGTRPGR